MSGNDYVQQRVAAARKALSMARTELENAKTRLDGDDHGTVANLCSEISDIRDRLVPFETGSSDG